MSAPRSLAERYHLETKYSLESIGQLPPMGPQPALYKDFQSDRAVDLRPFLPFKGFPYEDEPEEPNFAEATAGSLLPRLSRLLYFTNGVTGFFKHPDGLALFRAAPSAGGLYPTEIYVATEGVEGLEDAVHSYSVPRHKLVPVFDGELLDELSAACFDHPAARQCRAMVILTGVFQRSSFRYHDRAYRRILLDTGHVAGNLCAYSSEERLTPVPLSSFADEPVNRLLFLESGEEGALALIPLLEDLDPADSTTRVRAHRSSSAELKVEAGESLLQAVHRASTIEERARGAEQESVLPFSSPGKSSTGKTRPCEKTLAEIGAQLPAVIARRRSTRVFSCGLLARPDLESILDFSYQTASKGLLSASGQLETFIVALRVKGLEPGVYQYYSDEHELVLVRSGQFEAAVHHACLQQDLGRDAAAVVVHAADLVRAVEQAGNRAYRTLHLEAGLVGQWINLAAAHLEVGVTGIGGFFDDEVCTICSLPPTHAILYLTLLGEAEGAV